MRITPLLLVTSAWAALVPTPRPVTSQEISIISRNPKPLALAKPTDDSIVPPAKRGASFSLGEVHNMDYQGGDAPMEILKAHTKFGNTLPPKLARAVERNPKMNARFKILLGALLNVKTRHWLIKETGDITGTVVAYPPPFYDIQYVVPVFIGTPLQEVYLNLDTGSADLCVSPSHVTFSMTHTNQLDPLNRYLPTPSKRPYTLPPQRIHNRRPARRPSLVRPLRRRLNGLGHCLS